MAVTVFASGNIDVPEWADLWHLHGRGAWDEIVDDNALAVVPGAGARQVVIHSGIAAAAGALLRSTTDVTLTLAANGSGSARVDFIVAEITWSGNVGTIKAITGATGGSAPSLTKTRGVVWQIPLARVTVASGAGVLSAGAVEQCQPSARQVLSYSTDITERASIPFGSAGSLAGTIEIPDPGWPYRLRVAGAVKAANRDNGLGNIRAQVTIDDGPVFTQGISDKGCTAPAVVIPKTSGVRRGKAATVKLTVVPNTISGTDDLSTTQVGSGFNVDVLPAT